MHTNSQRITNSKHALFYQYAGYALVTTRGEHVIKGILPFTGSMVRPNYSSGPTT